MATPHDHHSAAWTDEAAMAELLDLDAEVLHTCLSEMTAWIQEFVSGDPDQILDLGSGTGTGTFALLERFEKADAIALDISAPLLHHLRKTAHSRGVADRVRIVQADLDATWPGIGPVDLVWASASLHHMADPDRVLTDVFTALRPGGLLAAVEIDSFPRFLPDDIAIGRPGLEARCHDALAEDHADRVPLLGSDWGPRLTKAGFAVVAKRTFTVDLTSPLPAAAGRYAQAVLRRMRSGLGDRLNADDRAALDALLDGDGPESILWRDDLHVRAARTVWVGQRP